MVANNNLEDEGLIPICDLLQSKHTISKLNLSAYIS